MLAIILLALAVILCVLALIPGVDGRVQTAGHAALAGGLLAWKTGY